jgi:hypothetical protein
MLPYKNVYSLENGRLVKNTENKIEYIDKNGKKRVKTNPSYDDFAKVGKYPLRHGDTGALFYEIKDGYIVAKEEKE